jgi:hypothetical protein
MQYNTFVKLSEVLVRVVNKGPDMSRFWADTPLYTLDRKRNLNNFATPFQFFKTAAQRVKCLPMMTCEALEPSRQQKPEIERILLRYMFLSRTSSNRI